MSERAAAFREAAAEATRRADTRVPFRRDARDSATERALRLFAEWLTSQADAALSAQAPAREAAERDPESAGASAAARPPRLPDEALAAISIEHERDHSDSTALPREGCNGCRLLDYAWSLREDRDEARALLGAAQKALRAIADDLEIAADSIYHGGFPLARVEDAVKRVRAILSPSPTPSGSHVHDFEPEGRCACGEHIAQVPYRSPARPAGPRDPAP